MKPIVVGNWKMHMTASDVPEYARVLLEEPSVLERADVIICPPHPLIPAVAKAFTGSPVRWGGQNAHWESSGAFTGETAMPMLADLGCSAVICGHSERRRFNRETDEDIGRKVQQAAAHSLTPILCVGETYEQRHLQQHEVVVLEQIRRGLQLIAAFPSLTLMVAYEPVWAIGTGQAIAPADALAMARLIRSTLAMFPTGADSVPILYGGSTTPLNVASFVDGEVTSGVLVGGSSLEPDTFHQLITQLL